MRSSILHNTKNLAGSTKENDFLTYTTPATKPSELPSTLLRTIAPNTISKQPDKKRHPTIKGNRMSSGSKGKPRQIPKQNGTINRDRM